MIVVAESCGFTSIWLSGIDQIRQIPLSPRSFGEAVAAHLGDEISVFIYMHAADNCVSRASLALSYGGSRREARSTRPGATGPAFLVPHDSDRGVSIGPEDRKSVV